MQSAARWNDVNISCPEVWFIAYSLLKEERKAKLIFKYLNQNVERLNNKIVMELIDNKEISEELRKDLIKLINEGSQQRITK